MEKNTNLMTANPLFLDLNQENQTGSFHLLCSKHLRILIITHQDRPQKKVTFSQQFP